MSWSSNSPLAVLRDSMWGFLVFAGAAWLAIAWSVLRLEPTGIARVAGAVILFGAVTEALRALAGTRAWWLNAAMAALFAVTGVLLLVDRDSSFTTPSALIGWYLIVRGAVDVAVATVSRVADRGWGLTMVLGVVQVGLGFFAASRYSRTAEVVVLVLGALALMRGVADLVASLILRETAVASDRPREKAAGLAGYAAGLADFAAAATATARSGRARHRATGLLGARAGSTATVPGATDVPADEADRAMAEHAMADRAMADRAMAGAGMAGAGMAGAGMADGTMSGRAIDDRAMNDGVTADLDAVLALAGMSGAITGAQPAVGSSSPRDGVVAATMFTGPHHTDSRDGGDVGPEPGVPARGAAASTAGPGMAGNAPSASRAMSNSAGPAMTNAAGPAMGNAAGPAMTNAAGPAMGNAAGPAMSRPDGPAIGNAAASPAGPGAGGATEAQPRRAGRRGATRADRATRADGATRADRSAQADPATRADRSALADRAGQGEASGGAERERRGGTKRERANATGAERGGGLAVRTARLFGRAGRDSR